MTHELAQQNRFTRSNFSSDEHEAFLGSDSMNQRGQALKVTRVIIKKARIGRYSKRHFAKTKMAVKHCFVFLGLGKFAHLSTLLMKAVCVQPTFVSASGGTEKRRENLAINGTLWSMVVR
jgi:hypothetical protein